LSNRLAIEKRARSDRVLEHDVEQRLTQRDVGPALNRCGGHMRERPLVGIERDVRWRRCDHRDELWRRKAAVVFVEIDPAPDPLGCRLLQHQFRFRQIEEDACGRPLELAHRADRRAYDDAKPVGLRHDEDLDAHVARDFMCRQSRLHRKTGHQPEQNGCIFHRVGS